MTSPPTIPRYAMATAAWKARIAPERSKTRDIALPRPKQPLQPPQPPRPMRPQDPSKLCYFARLPAELRLQVYECVLPSDPLYLPVDRAYLKACTRFLPALLHVSSLVRLEVANLFYRLTHFTYESSSFDFRPLDDWLTAIPVLHRAFLAKNKHLTIVIHRGLTPMDRQRELCKIFCNRYLIPKGPLLEKFIHFCQLVHWAQWCGERSIAKNLSWNYKFEIEPTSYYANAVWPKRFWGMAALCNWFNAHLWTITQPNIQNAWARNVRKSTMKKELLEILKNWNKAWKESAMEIISDVSYAASPSQELFFSWLEEWDRRVAILAEEIDKW